MVMSALWLLLHKTAFGRVVRAGVQRPDMVAVPSAFAWRPT